MLPLVFPMFMPILTAKRPEDSMHYLKVKTTLLCILSLVNAVLGILQCFCLTGMKRKDRENYLSSMPLMITSSFIGPLLYIVTAFIGHSASYSPTKRMLMITIIFSILSFFLALCISLMKTTMMFRYPVTSASAGWIITSYVLPVVFFCVIINNATITVIIVIGMRQGFKRMLFIFYESQPSVMYGCANRSPTDSEPNMEDHELQLLEDQPPSYDSVVFLSLNYQNE